MSNKISNILHFKVKKCTNTKPWEDSRCFTVMTAQVWNDLSSITLSTLEGYVCKFEIIYQFISGKQHLFIISNAFQKPIIRDTIS